jgi:hypothetical protein
MRAVADSMKSKSGTNGAQQAFEGDSDIPEPPVPPDDPFSEEGEQYNKKLYAWAQTLTAAQRTAVAGMKQQQQLQEQQAQQRLLLNEAQSEAMHRFHLPQDKAGALVEDLRQDGPAIVKVFGSIDEYVKYKYSTPRAQTAEEIRQAKAIESARTQQQQRTPPLATGVMGGTAPPQGPQFAGFSERARNPYES